MTRYWLGVVQRAHVLRIAIADDDHLAVLQQVIGRLGQDRDDMRDLLLDVCAVRPVQVGVGDVRIVHPDVIAAADEALHQRDQRALAQVIGAGLGAQADHAGTLET